MLNVKRHLYLTVSSMPISFLGKVVLAELAPTYVDDALNQVFYYTIPLALYNH